MARLFAIEVAETQQSVSCPETRSILDACLGAGIPFPYNCRSGECGECLAQRIRGDVRELPGADPAIFNDKHRAAGLFLACLSYPRSDLTISVSMSARERSPIRTVRTVITKIERHGESIVELRTRADEPISYCAGQYFEWVLPAISPNRSYSVANRPGSTTLEFHIRLYSGGRVSELLRLGDLCAGRELALRGPYGAFGFSEEKTRPAILIAGGTGMAPIKAMLDEAFACGIDRPLQFFYGTRRATDLYHMETMAAWMRLHPNFQFIPALSHEPAESEWTGARGLVTDIVARHIADAFGAEAYVCGPPAMVETARTLLARLGVDDADIHCDKFTMSSSAAP